MNLLATKHDFVNNIHLQISSTDLKEFIIVFNYQLNFDIFINLNISPYSIGFHGKVTTVGVYYWTITRTSPFIWFNSIMDLQ